jgi:hypothetical protein
MADVSSNLYQWSTTAASNNPAGSTTIGTGLDDNLREIQAVVRTEYNKHVVTHIPCGRLTLTTAVPVTTADVTAAETLYYTPFRGNTIVLFDGTNWRQYTFTELSIDVPDATQVQDVFVYDNAGTVSLELTTWTNDTTRATALTTQNGVLVKTGALTRRYVGTFYSTTAGNGQTEDSFAKRYVWNYYHRVSRPMRNATETANSWNYSLLAYQQANANAANQLDFVIGVSEDTVSATVLAHAQNTTQNGGGVPGIGLDATNANASGVQAQQMLQETAGAGTITGTAQWTGFPGVGKHFLAWLETGNATGTMTWFGDNGGTGSQQSGIQGVILG